MKYGIGLPSGRRWPLDYPVRRNRSVRSAWTLVETVLESTIAQTGERGIEPRFPLCG